MQQRKPLRTILALVLPLVIQNCVASRCLNPEYEALPSRRGDALSQLRRHCFHATFFDDQVLSDT